jgi:hypothetical protein
MPSTLLHVHCEVGTWGHNVHDDIRAAYNEWEDDHFAIVNKVNKGDRGGRVTYEGWAPSIHQLLPILTNVCVIRRARLQSMDGAIFGYSSRCAGRHRL